MSPPPPRGGAAFDATAADCGAVVDDAPTADSDDDNEDDNVRPFVRAFTVLACSLGNAGGQEDEAAVIADPTVGGGGCFDVVAPD